MDIVNINLDINSSVPLYIQIYEFIKSEIQKGNLKANIKLTSKRKLSAYLGISQNTVEAAYAQLVAEGYITAIEKRGYFVAELSGIICIPERREEGKRKLNNKKKYKYEFLSSRVDLESFPYNLWKRINKDIINEDNRDILQIGHSQGDYNLREVISDYLRYSRGVKAEAERIVIGAGTEYLIQVLLNLIGKDKLYGMEEPGYYKIRRILKNNNIDVRGVKIDEQGISIEELYKSNCNVIHITPSHQFPMGIIMPIKRRMDLLNWAREDKNRYIIEDDYDSEFRFEGRPIPSLQSLDNDDKVIYLGTLSKAFAPSIRVAYMVLPKSLIKIYRENFSFYACTVSRLTQQALYKFISEGHFERHLNKMRNIYKKKREFLVSQIKSNLKNTEIIGTKAGLHLLLKVNNGMREEELIKRAAENEIRILGLSNSYLDYSSKESIVFIGYGALSLKDIERGIALLKKSWEL